LNRRTMKDYTFVKPETDEEYEAHYSVMDSVLGDEDVRVSQRGSWNTTQR
jgi:hypothetical protein